MVKKKIKVEKGKKKKKSNLKQNIVKSLGYHWNFTTLI